MPTIRSALLISALMVAATPEAIPGERNRIVFNRLAPVRIGLFLADADGRNERALLPATGLDYDASFSPEGKWIIFTSEREARGTERQPAPELKALRDEQNALGVEPPVFHDLREPWFYPPR